VPRLPQFLLRVRGHGLSPGEYVGPDWDPGLVGHSFEWISQQCERRGLRARELDYNRIGSQVWLRIDHP
jgi:hypothetical protein